MQIFARAFRVGVAAASLFSILASGCGSGGAAGDWYYHWNCNGDPECLTTNPTGQPSGSSDEGNQISCTQVMQFGTHFWGSAATQSCDQSPGAASGQVTITGFSPAASAPGDKVVITGTNFPATSSIKVTINGIQAVATGVSSTEIDIAVPAMGDFTGPISLTTPAGTVVSGSAFSVANNLYGVVWTGARFVAVGGDGTVLTSADAVTWVPAKSGTTRTLASVSWSGTLLVAVGSAGTILTSADGASWTARSSGTISDLLGSTWSGSQFVAVGSGGALLTSPDGIAWTSRSPGTAAFLDGVAWSGTGFVAVGGSGTLLTSPDGIAWTAGTSGTGNALYQVARSGTGFAVAGGNGSGGNLFTSADGITWAPRTAATVNALYGITWSGSQFAAVGSYGSIVTSPDGSSWTARSSGTTVYLAAVTWSGTMFVAVGASGTIVASSSGATWTQSSTPGVTPACLPLGLSCLTGAQCCSAVCDCGRHQCVTTRVICGP